jgi:SAM-dependent methyltransferase
MKFLDLKDISERDMELINPTSPAKILAAGRAAGLKPSSRVIEFGCGYGEVLALWAAQFGISGQGIEVRSKACERARQKMIVRALADRIEIVCGDGATTPVEAGAYDVAACIGASFIWDGFRPALQHMKPALRAGGRIVIGELYWRTAQVPPEFSRGEPTVPTEFELLQIIWGEGLDLEFVVRSSQDDWDRYEAADWQGLVRWLEENPGHRDRGEVIEHLRQSQDEYLRYGREYFGWAIYVLGQAHAA